MASRWVMAPEFVRMAPPGVLIGTARIRFQGATFQGLGGMAGSPEVEACTELLISAPLSAICFGGRTSSASVRALRAFGTHRVAFVGPYNDEVTARGLRTLGALAALESELGKPVIAAIQASSSGSLRLDGVHVPVPGYGALLARQARLAGAAS
jgi:maleate cis-trans isomerase